MQTIFKVLCMTTSNTNANFQQFKTNSYLLLHCFILQQITMSNRKYFLHWLLRHHTTNERLKRNLLAHCCYLTALRWENAKMPWPMTVPVDPDKSTNQKCHTHLNKLFLMVFKKKIAVVISTIHSGTSWGKFIHRSEQPWGKQQPSFRAFKFISFQNHSSDTEELVGMREGGGN